MNFNWEFVVSKRALAIVLHVILGSICVGYGMAQIKAGTANLGDVACLIVGLVLFWLAIRNILWGEEPAK